MLKVFAGFLVLAPLIFILMTGIDYLLMLSFNGLGANMTLRDTAWVFNLYIAGVTILNAIADRSK